MEARKLSTRMTPGHNDQDESSRDPRPTVPLSPLSPLAPLARLYVYALHGCVCELLFTSVYDWCSTGDGRLTGHSSLWAIPMYSLAMYTMEGIRARLLARQHPLLVRLLAYTAFIYLWEFTWGSGLSALGVCPWDYSGFRYNLRGLVTLEYALPWTVAGFLAEQHVIKNTLRIRM